MPTTTYTIVHGEVLSENRNGTERAYLFDVIGSTMALADSSQTVTDTFSYWPFGEQKSHSGASVTPLRFLGAYGARRDSATRTHIGARELRTNLARWSQMDRLRTDRTRYSYGFDNPLKYRDANGLFNGVAVGPPPFMTELELFPKLIPPGAPGPVPGPAPIGAGPIAVVIVGAVALIDVINWGITGNEGLITGRGGDLGRRIFPDSPDLPGITPEEWEEILRDRGQPYRPRPWFNPGGRKPCNTTNSEPKPVRRWKPDPDPRVADFEYCTEMCDTWAILGPNFKACCDEWCDLMSNAARKGLTRPTWDCTGLFSPPFTWPNEVIFS